MDVFIDFKSLAQQLNGFEDIIFITINLEVNMWIAMI